MNRQIVLDEIDHVYTNEVKQRYTSVTTVIGQYQEEFDKEYWAVYTALKNMNIALRPDLQSRRIIIANRSYTLEQIGRDEYLKGVARGKKVEDLWKKICDESCVRGTAIHNKLEDGINKLYKREKDQITEDARPLSLFPVQAARTELGVIVSEAEIRNSNLRTKYPTVFSLLLELISKGYILYAERRVYSDLYMVAGTIDLLAIRGKDFIIIDWKTNKDEMKFKTGYYKKVQVEREGRRTWVKGDKWIDTDDRLKFPLDHLQSCKGNIYGMQLSTYAYLMEQFGFNHLSSILVHLRQEVIDWPVRQIIAHDPKFYTMPDLKMEAKLMLENFKNKQNGITINS